MFFCEKNNNNVHLSCVHQCSERLFVDGRNDIPMLRIVKRFNVYPYNDDPRIWLFINSCMIMMQQKVTDLVHGAITSFISTMVSSSVTRKELFHNMTTLLAKQPNPLFLLVIISNNFQASSPTLSKAKSSPFKTAFRMWHRRICELSVHILWYPISLLDTSLWTIC